MHTALVIRSDITYSSFPVNIVTNKFDWNLVGYPLLQRGGMETTNFIGNCQCATVTKCNVYMVESCIHLLECVNGIMYMYSDSIEMKGE